MVLLGKYVEISLEFDHAQKIRPVRSRDYQWYLGWIQAQFWHAKGKVL